MHVGYIGMGTGSQEHVLIYKPTTQGDGGLVPNLGGLTGADMPVTLMPSSNAYLDAVLDVAPSGLFLGEEGAMAAVFDYGHTEYQYNYMVANYPQQSWVQGGFLFSPSYWVEVSVSGVFGAGLTPYCRTRLADMTQDEYMQGYGFDYFAHSVTYGIVFQNGGSNTYVRSGATWNLIQVVPSHTTIGTVYSYAYLVAGASVGGVTNPAWTIGSAAKRTSTNIDDDAVALNEIYGMYLSA